jgi:hypothetical protein
MYINMWRYVYVELCGDMNMNVAISEYGAMGGI